MSVDFFVHNFPAYLQLFGTHSSIRVGGRLIFVNVQKAAQVVHIQTRLAAENGLGHFEKA